MAIPEISSDCQSVVPHRKAEGESQQQVCKNTGCLSKLRITRQEKPLTQEQIAEQGTILFQKYIASRTCNEHVMPKSPTLFVNSETQTSPPIEVNPIFKEIVKQADAFEETDNGRRVQDAVNELNLEQISQNAFDLFVANISNVWRNVPGGAGFNSKTLVATFLCLGQVILKALKNYALASAQKYIRWCFDYIEGKLSRLVRQGGGYEVILGIAFWKTVKKCCLSLGLLSVAAAGLYYIWKD